MGEVPTTTVTFFVSRQHLQDVLDGGKIIYSDRNNGVILGECGELNATFIHRREHHRGVGKELWSVTLDKGGRRRTDAYNEVRLLFSEERAEIRDERNLRVFIAGTGRHKRMVSDVQLPRRLPLQLAANGPGILAPGFEILTKGMQEHYPLGVGRGGTPPSEEHRQNEEQSYATANARGVPAGMPAGPLHYNPQFRHPRPYDR